MFPLNFPKKLFPSGLSYGVTGEQEEGVGLKSTEYSSKRHHFKEARTETDTRLDTRGGVMSDKRHACRAFVNGDGAMAAITKYSSSSETIKHIYSLH